MKENFKETVQQASVGKLQKIAADHTFYSETERYLALGELEARGELSQEMAAIKADIELSLEIEGVPDELHEIVESHEVILTKTPLLSFILAGANILVFLLMALSGANLLEPDVQTLIHWGGNLRTLTINGQLWRLLTSVFVHTGILHLACNMWVLINIGILLENIISRRQFALACLYSGLAASITSLWVHENTVSVGASGAIFGLCGLLLTLLVMQKTHLSGGQAKNIRWNILAFVLLNVITGFTKPGIDNAAHVGGLIAGIAIGAAYIIAGKSKIRMAVADIILATLLSAVITAATIRLPDKFRQFSYAMNLFMINEQKAVWMYDANLWLEPKDTRASQQFRNRLVNEGVAVWEENIRILRELRAKEFALLPDKHLELLTEYAEMRKHACELFIKEHDGDTSKLLRQEMIDLQGQIETKLQEMRNLNPQ